MSFCGFRQWAVDADGMLAPGMKRVSFRWSAVGRTEAQCHCSWAWHNRPIMHLTATMTTAEDPGYRRCGLWVHDRPIPSCYCSEPDGPLHGVVGVVRCGGRYTRHTQGWRVQYAIPVAVVDFTGGLSRAYDQIGLRRYPDLATMYGEWFPDDDRRRAEVLPVWHQDVLQVVPSLTEQPLTATYAPLMARLRSVASEVSSPPMTKLMQLFSSGLADGVDRAIKEAQQRPSDPPFQINL